MTDEKQDRIRQLIDRIPTLTHGQLHWLNKVVKVFDARHSFEIQDDSIIDQETLNSFGDALRIHHSFSADPFSKDKFEYILETVLNLSGPRAQLASKGNRGHDITIDSVPVSLKTQADKNIKRDKIWISKFMELGKGTWGEDPQDLVGLRKAFLAHLNGYDRIFTLRTLTRAPEWEYELVEIPKCLLLEAQNGRLQMQSKSKQYPKPGYCYVSTRSGVDAYQLYFDGGGERKLQIKHLLKSCCQVHATWKFIVP